MAAIGPEATTALHGNDHVKSANPHLFKSLVRRRTRRDVSRLGWDNPSVLRRDGSWVRCFHKPDQGQLGGAIAAVDYEQSL